MQRPDACPLCSGGITPVTDSAPGYQQGQSFAVMECASCCSSFAVPLAVDDRIYGHIYRNIRFAPGYNRYYRFAREVLVRKRPLDYLSSQEESYWAVAEHLRQRRTAGLRILEIGCGMGYFTHALVKDGFSAEGIDLSEQAVSWAREHYGPYYATTPVAALAASGRRFDAIVMNQLLEHLPDVHGFLAGVLGLLAPAGELLITTPNKSVFPGSEWETDLPPIHLWWFGEEALQAIARRHGCSVSFLDFTPFYRKFFRGRTTLGPIAARQPFLDEAGELLLRQEVPPSGALRRLLDDLGVLPLLRRARDRMAMRDRWTGPKGPIIAAVMRKK